MKKMKSNVVFISNDEALVNVTMSLRQAKLFMSGHKNITENLRHEVKLTVDFIDIYFQKRKEKENE